MKETWTRLRNSFFAGLLVVVPLAASLGILWWLFNKLTGLLLPDYLARRLPYPEFVARLLALMLFLALVTVLGWVARLVIGKRAITVADAIIGRIPLLNKIYAFVKDVSNTLLAGQKTVFDRVVLIEYPRPGVYAVGFVTSESEGEVQHKTANRVINVFLPTTPNPTSGFLLMVPRDQVIELRMSVAEGMKLVISGGSVVPPYLPLPPAPSPLPAAADTGRPAQS
jgi:uncharacterized membrane protein